MMQINPFKNTLLKVSAFVLAFLLWVHVATNKTYEYQFSLPLEITDVPEELILVNDLPGNIEIKVRATGKQLIALVMRNPRITVSVSGVKAGRTSKKIDNSDVIAALNRPYEGFDIILPQDLQLDFERKVEKKLLVRSTIKAEAALGFAVMSGPRIEPETVTVIGPASSLYRKRFLETERTEFIELDKSIVEEIALLIPDSLRLSVSDSTVLVSIDIETKKQKTFPSVMITLPKNFSTKRFTIVPESLSLSLEIPESQIDSFTVADFTVSFKRPSITRDTVKAAIRYTLPDHVSIIGPKIDSLLIIRKS